MNDIWDSPPSGRWLTEESYAIWNGPIPGAPPVPPTQNLAITNNAKGEWCGINLSGVAFPTLYVFRPENPNGVSVMIFPGGGYRFLSLQGESIDIAYHLKAQGITCFFLVYRLPLEGWAERHNVPLQDAQRAMRFIRANSAHFNIDPAKLGVMGFSAGGHLAASIATRHHEQAYPMSDAWDRLSARPNFACLLFPVISLQPPVFDYGMRQSLFDPDASNETINARCPDLCVTPETPPCFLVHAFDDPLVPFGHPLRMMESLRAQNIPIEAHFFQSGGHGFDISLPEKLPAAHWPVLFCNWLRLIV